MSSIHPKNNIEDVPYKIDKRICKRHELIYYLELLAYDTERCLGHILDISSEGMMVMSERPFAMHEVYFFKISYRIPHKGRHTFPIKARSRWCSRDIHANFFDTGFEMVELNQHALQSIEFIIKTMCY